MEYLARRGAAEIGAIADPEPGNLEQAAGLAWAARKLASLDELLELDLDGVVIATPSALHAEQAERCLEKGLPVFCQKPIGRTAEETRAVVAAARKRDRLLGVDFSYRFVAAMRQVHELCRSGDLGQVYAADLVFHNAYGPDKEWFYDWRRSGGGCVIDLGIHLVDQALWNLGFPDLAGVSSRLYAQGLPMRGRGGAVEDFAEARIDLANETTVRIACSWRLPAGRDAVIEGSFYGTKGGAKFHNIDGSFYHFAAERFTGTRCEPMPAEKEEWGGKALMEWVNTLNRSRRFSENAREFIRTAEVIDEIYANSCAGGRQ